MQGKRGVPQGAFVTDNITYFQRGDDVYFERDGVEHYYCPLWFWPLSMPGRDGSVPTCNEPDPGIDQDGALLPL
jgi:hypothetical protein